MSFKYSKDTFGFWNKIGALTSVIKKGINLICLNEVIFKARN